MVKWMIQEWRKRILEESIQVALFRQNFPNPKATVQNDQILSRLKVGKSRSKIGVCLNHSRAQNTRKTHEIPVVSLSASSVETGDTRHKLRESPLKSTNIHWPQKQGERGSQEMSIVCLTHRCLLSVPQCVPACVPYRLQYSAVAVAGFVEGRSMFAGHAIAIALYCVCTIPLCICPRWRRQLPAGSNMR